MRHLLIDIAFALFYLVVLAVFAFGLTGMLLTSVLLFVILVVNVLYKLPLSDSGENMGKEFVESEARREERLRKRLSIDRMIAIIDAMVANVRKLHILIRSVVYVLE